MLVNVYEDASYSWFPTEASTSHTVAIEMDPVMWQDFKNAIGFVESVQVHIDEQLHLLYEAERAFAAGLAAPVEERKSVLSKVLSRLAG